MSPLEKFQFIESHSENGKTSLYHSVNFSYISDLNEEAKKNFQGVNIYNYKFGNLVANNCNYLACEFDMLRGSSYDQIFVDSGLHNKLYIPLLKPNSKGFIYDFQLEEYTWDGDSR